MNVSIFFFQSYQICLIYFVALVRYIHIYGCHVCLEDLSIYHYVTSLFISDYIPCYDIYSILVLYILLLFCLSVCHIFLIIYFSFRYIFIFQISFLKTAYSSKGFPPVFEGGRFCRSSSCRLKLSFHWRIGELAFGRIWGNGFFSPPLASNMKPSFSVFFLIFHMTAGKVCGGKSLQNGTSPSMFVAPWGFRFSCYHTFSL